MSDDESEFILFIVQLYNIAITFTTDNVTLNDVSFLCVLVDVDICSSTANKAVYNVDNRRICCHVTITCKIPLSSIRMVYNKCGSCLYRPRRFVGIFSGTNAHSDFWIGLHP